jgi:hypothetical protein
MTPFEKAVAESGLGCDPTRMCAAMVKGWLDLFPRMNRSELAADAEALGRLCAQVQAELRGPEVPTGLMRQLVLLTGI